MNYPIIISAALLLFVASVDISLEAQTGSTTHQELHPMAISVFAPKDKKVISGPIFVQYSITNTGTVPEYFETMAGRSEYDLVHVTLTYNGQMVPEKAFSRRLRGQFHEGDPRAPDIGSKRFIRIDPGKSLTLQIDLTKLYNITQPGSYLCSVHLSPDSFNKQSEETKPIVLDINP